MSESTVAKNSRVELELIANDRSREKLELVLVPDNAADFDKGLLGISTPLAQTLLGHSANETLDYKRGDIVQVKILSVRENTELPVSDAAEQREETLRRARDKAEHANMVSFALTFDSKWGDYDPTNIAEDWAVPKEDAAQDTGQTQEKKEEG